MLDTRIRTQATALERKNRQLEHILDITGATRLDQPLSALLQRLAHATCDALDFHIAVVYLAEPGGDVFYARASEGLDAKGWSDVARRTIPRLVAARLMDPLYRLSENTFFIPHDAPVWDDPLVDASLSTLAQGPALPPGAEWHPDDCLLVPLMTAERALIGLITPDLPVEGCVPTPEMAHVLEIFANSAALLIQNARLYEREVTRAAALEEISRLRHDFIATVSHELRTPLTSIIGFTETLLSYWDRLPEPRKLDMLSKSKSSIYRLNRLVQDLLLTSGIDAEALTLEPREVALSDLIEQAASEVRGKYGAQRIVYDSAAGPQVYADPHRVEQVLINLIDNAAEMSPDRAQIEVSTEAGDDMAVVRVRDHGPGIPRDKQHMLFTRFGKIDNAIRSGHVGTGLGLYITKKLTEAMGGSVWLESSGAEGTVFAFSLPQTPGKLARPRSLQDRRYT